MFYDEAFIKTIPGLVSNYSDPLFVYSKSEITNQINLMRSTNMPSGLTLRYAMKANPYKPILTHMLEKGVHIDASSSYEAANAIKAGFLPEQIRLTSQQLPHDWGLIKAGVLFNACSLHQLQAFGEQFPGKSCSLRINPGEGSGHSVKANVGGVLSSFGVWHEYIKDIIRIAAKYNVTIDVIHTHIGSGTDPVVWETVAKQSVRLLEHFPQATTLNLGGGFKVARIKGDSALDLPEILQRISGQLKYFQEQTGRAVHLELEPGTFLVANAGVLAARVIDIVNTGTHGYTFLKLNTGMNDILRPALYGAQHPLRVLSKSSEQQDYVVVGHNCESGDLLTTAPGNPDETLPRRLQKAAIGDLVLIGGAGAYCASMAAHGYNAFPSASEVLV